MMINSVWDPIAKSSIHLNHRLKDGSYMHINKYHKLFAELKENPGRLFDIPFYTKQKTMVRFVGNYIGTYKQKGNELMYIGLHLEHYKDNFMFIKMYKERTKRYGNSKRKNKTNSIRD